MGNQLFQSYWFLNLLFHNLFLVNKDAEIGILFCGTGIGMTIAANKVKGIYCARITNVKEAKLAKEHNDANVIALSGNIWPFKAITLASLCSLASFASFTFVILAQ